MFQHLLPFYIGIYILFYLDDMPRTMLTFNSIMVHCMFKTEHLQPFTPRNSNKFISCQVLYLLFMKLVDLRICREDELFLSLKVIREFTIKRLVIVLHGESEILDEISFWFNQMVKSISVNERCIIIPKWICAKLHNVFLKTDKFMI